MLAKLKKCYLLIKLLSRNRKLEVIGGPRWLKYFGVNNLNVNGYYSQYGQDKYIEQLSDRLGIKIQNILDVGCNDPVKYNNSFYFEKKYGSRVYAIDAIDRYKQRWRECRQDAVFIKTAVGESDGKVRFYVNKNDDMLSSLDVVGNKGTIEVSHIDVSIKRLDAILEELRIDAVDFLSMDIEGAELSAIKGLSLDINRPKIILIENNSDKERMGCWQLRDYISEHDYLLIGRFWGLDDVFIDAKIVNLNGKW